MKQSRYYILLCELPAGLSQLKRGLALETSDGSCRLIEGDTSTCLASAELEDTGFTYSTSDMHNVMADVLKVSSNLVHFNVRVYLPAK